MKLLIGYSIFRQPPSGSIFGCDLRFKIAPHVPALTAHSTFQSLLLHGWGLPEAYSTQIKSLSQFRNEHVAGVKKIAIKYIKIIKCKFLYQCFDRDSRRLSFKEKEGFQSFSGSVKPEHHQHCSTTGKPNGTEVEVEQELELELASPILSKPSPVTCMLQIFWKVLSLTQIIFTFPQQSSDTH